MPRLVVNLLAGLEDGKAGIAVAWRRADVGTHSLLGYCYPWFVCGDVDSQGVLVDAFADFRLI